jgi:hypothetical protein
LTCKTAEHVWKYQRSAGPRRLVIRFSAHFTPCVEIGWRMGLRALGTRLCNGGGPISTLLDCGTSEKKILTYWPLRIRCATGWSFHNRQLVAVAKRACYGLAWGRCQMPMLSAKPTQFKCPTCKGTGFLAVKQPAEPGRKIYPARCERCDGKGWITQPN